VNIKQLDFAGAIRHALEAAGMRLGGDTDCSGVQVVPVAAGVRIHWVPGTLDVLLSAEALANMRLIVHAAVAGVLGEFGYDVMQAAPGSDVLVRPKRPAPVSAGAVALWGR
jgi:hypothetical protein